MIRNTIEQHVKDFSVTFPPHIDGSERKKMKIERKEGKIERGQEG